MSEWGKFVCETQSPFYFRRAKLLWFAGFEGFWSELNFQPSPPNAFEPVLFTVHQTGFLYKMKNLLFSFLALCALLCSLGCPPPPPPAIKFGLDKPFSLKMGQTGESSDVQGFAITFEKVAADSRCPQGVKCVTAGQADVVVTLNKAGESETLTLPFTLTNGTTNVTDFKGHTVRVVGVIPFKIKDREIKPEEYVITLMVTETPPLLPPPPPPALGEDFTLAMGESEAFDELGKLIAEIRFDSVAGDSRCAEGVQCIWAGRADCVFSLMTDGSTQQVTLSTGDLSKGGKGETKIGTYTLKIKAVEPSPKQGTPIYPKDYKATLVLTK